MVLYGKYAVLLAHEPFVFSVILLTKNAMLCLLDYVRVGNVEACVPEIHMHNL